MAPNPFSHRKMDFPLYHERKNGLWDQKYYVYRGESGDFFGFVLFVWGGEECDNSPAVLNLYLRWTIIKSRLNWFKNILWTDRFTIIFLRVFFSLALRRPCNSPCLLVTDFRDVLALDYDNKSIFPVVSVSPRVRDVDFHYNQGYIFWCVMGLIQRSNMDGTNITVIHYGVLCRGLAVEWDSFQLYWTSYFQTIMVSDLDGNNKRTVFSSLLGPSDIVLDPHQG